MDKSQSTLRRFGMSAIAAGAILFASGQASAAEEGTDLGEKLLYEGKVHEHVVELKELLGENDLLDATHSFDSTFDAHTAEAVRNFQAENDLLVDGLPGVQTLGALSELSHGDTGYLVEELQKDLAELGLYGFNIDGIFGPITEEALVIFQSNHGVTEDPQGVAGPETYAALHEVTSRYNPGVNQTEPAQEAAPAEEPVVEEPVQEEVPAEEPVAEETPAEEPVVEEPAQEEAPAEEAVQAESTTEAAQATSNETDGTTLNMEATAYTAYCEGCSGVTFTGIDLRSNPDQKVVAVDPDVIPLGSIVEVEGYGRAVAGDIGGAIQGNKIDLFMPSREDALNFGRQNVSVTIVETP
ncbi:peptidoglycan-binding protein [Paenalkalicoccus suaedae]|uniref:Peptidoglycan-binding protein n=1 Tax=Paenalkalicoccus suaedae TaxID=2592382 RepID=A0A859FBG2_9BACI|nr:peptidoglycan-binding protein [Paenalkalicoccus suaedae]QKS70693.1 peptidoglycan-binding protein [Paenalkalicoccus suaedae]